MSLSRSFYWLFSVSLIVLFVLLGYGWQVIYKAEIKKVQEDIDRVAQSTADSLQDANYKLYDIFRVNADKEYNEKLAFAAGLTQNKKRMSISFDDDTTSSSNSGPVSEKQNNLIVVPTANSLANKETQTAIRRNLPKGMSISFGNSTLPKHQSAGGKKKHDSVIMTYNIQGEPPIRLAVNKKALDSAKKYVPSGLKTIKYYDTLLTTRLNIEGLPLKYTVEKVRRPLSAVRWASGFFIIDLYDPVVYRVVYDFPKALLIKRLLPYSGVAVFLLVLISAAFLLYHRSYKMQLQTAQFRDSLLSNVTHELKTPVASLQLIINSLQRSDEGEAKRQQYIDFADKELGRMKTLIEKILSFSKLNERQFDLNKEIIDVAALIREAMAIIQPAVANAAGTIEFEEQTNAEVMGDKILLLNLIINLVDNAIKYSKGAPVIRIRLTSAQGMANISISDNGIGIPAQYHKKIFEPFFRVPTGDRHNIPGHGIGLSFVNQTVQLHKGHVSLTSEKEWGTTFTVSLPTL